MNKPVRIACPRQINEDDACEADLVVWIGGKGEEDSFIDLIEDAPCGHILTEAEQEVILERANRELADRERDRMEYRAEDRW